MCVCWMVRYCDIARATGAGEGRYFLVGTELSTSIR